MENCKAAWRFVNQGSMQEGFHLANWVSLMCYFVPVIGLIFLLNLKKSLISKINTNDPISLLVSQSFINQLI